MGKYLIMSLCAAVVAGCGQTSNTADMTSPDAKQTTPIAVPSETAVPKPAAPPPPAQKSGPPQSIEDGIAAYVERNFDDAFTIKVTSVRSADVWDFACGDLVPPDESPARNFCALLKDEAAGFNLLEFEITGHDAPYYDWFEAHGVPETIIGD